MDYVLDNHLSNTGSHNCVTRFGLKFTGPIV